MEQLYVLLLGLLTFIHCVSCHKILVLCATPKSHIMYIGEAAKALVDHGHDVTMVLGSRVNFPYNLQNSGIKFDYFHMDRPPITDSEDLVKSVVDASGKGFFSWQRMKSIKMLLRMLMEECGMILKDKELYNRLRDAKFDLAVVDVHILSFYAVPYKLGIPYVMLGPDCPWYAYKVPWSSSYVPNPALSYPDDMNLWQKTLNTIVNIMIIPPMVLFLDKTEEIEKYAPERPSISYFDLVAKSQMCFHLHTPVFDTPRARHPNCIEVGGLMGRTTAPLPDNILSLYNKSDHGVIVVSFGSWLNQLPPGVAEKFFKALSELPYSFIMKYSRDEKESTVVPPNVQLLPWLPQNDLLGHPNTKLLITHCGLGSILEAVYQGVPILGFPFGLDQEYNAMIVRRNDYGLILDLNTFSAYDVVDSVKTILNGDIPRNVKRASEIFQDMPDSRKVLAYWIDHVIKYGDNHLRPKVMDFTFLEYYMLDVVLVILLFVAAMFYTSKKCFKYIFGCIWCGKNIPHKKKKE